MRAKVFINITEEVNKMKTQNRAWHVRGSKAWHVSDSLDMSVSEIRKKFREDNIIAIGWTNFEDMSNLKSLESIKERLRNDTANNHSATQHYATYPRSLGIAAKTLDQFVNLMSIDDYIVFPDDRNIYFGKVSSNYYYDTTFVEGQYPHCRRVKWLLNKNPMLRVDLTESLQRQLRYPRTIKEYNYDEIQAVVTSKS